jgi:5-enolpyruvylshikimate-3-phosphate synthase
MMTRQIRIPVADAALTSRLLMLAALQNSEFEVTPAVDGEDALRQ